MAQAARQPVIDTADFPSASTTIALDTLPQPAPRPGPQAVPTPLKSGLHWLSPQELPAWDALVAASPQGSVFTTSWWLQAACGQARVLGCFDRGMLIAGMPLHYQRRMGLRLCVMPKLTQTMGVVMAPLAGKQVARAAREMEILDAFAQFLSQEQVFIQAFHPGIRNWLPFYWRGYTQTTHYTYVLDDLSSLDKLWDGMDSDRRTNVRKARRLGLKVRECSPGTVFEAACASFARQGLPCPYTRDYLHRLCEAARQNNAGVCMAAVDGESRVHGARFFVWDAKRGYGIAGGHNPEFGSSGGVVLLVWSLIEFAAQRTAVFDFEGSMRKPIEASFRSFGATAVPYNRIVRMSRWMRMALCAAGRVQI